MTKIIYGHSPDSFQRLKIAGDFSNWDPLPMVKNPKDGLWEYSIDLHTLPKSVTKVHFKFIDDNGVWFTDENYAKEVDDHLNENNVQLLTSEMTDSGSGASADEADRQESYEIDEEGPESPAPSLKGDSGDKPEGTKTTESKSLADPLKTNAIEDKDESVGGPAVLVNHSDVEDERQPPDEEERPNTSETAVTSRGNDPEQYKNVLARIIAFFTNLFHSWFS